MTTDVGAGDGTQYSVPGCVPGGDAGLLQVKALGPTCDRASITTGDHYLHLYRDATGNVGPNYDGTLAEALQCYAPQGTDGCRFPMPLEALSRALDPTNAFNGGIQQPGATLLVVIVTDQDDCSAPADTELFDPFQTDPTSVLGPLSTYRCFEFGFVCDGLPPGRSAGSRANCVPGAPDSDPHHELSPIDGDSGYAKQLSASHGDNIVVGVLAGPPSPVKVVVDGEGYSQLVPYCFVGGDGADPAIRLNAFAATRPTPNDVICSDYSAALAQWTQQALNLAAASRSCD